MDRRTTLNLFCTLLLAISLLGAFPPAQAQVSTDVIGAIRTETQDSTAPHGAWTKVTDKTTFFLHRDAELAPEDTPLGTAEDPAVYVDGGNYVNEDYYLDYEKPKIPVRDTATDPSGILFDTIVEDHRDPKDKKVTLLDSSITSGLGELGDGVFASFIVPENLTQTADVRVYGLEFEVYLQCQGSDDGASLEILNSEAAGAVDVRMILQRVIWTGTEWLDDTSAGSVTGRGHITSVDTNAVIRIAGATSIGNLDQENGNLFKAATGTDQAQRFMVRFSVTSGGVANCILHFDSLEYPSLVRFTTDATRLSTWAETKNGDFTQGIPNAQRAPAIDRRFLAQVTQASAWPHLNAFSNPRTDVASPCEEVAEGVPEPGCAAGVQEEAIDDNQPVDYMDDFWDLLDTANSPNAGQIGAPLVVAASDLRLRVRDLTTQNLVSGVNANEFQFHDRTVTHVGDPKLSVNRIQYLVTYPDTMPARDYRLEVPSSVQGTAVAPPVTMGLRGFTFTSIDDNTAAGLVHNVNPGEITDFRFRVRNTGGEDDTVTVVPSSPGNSWKAELLGPSTHLLKANGGEAEVVLRVTPPSSAAAGASQQVQLVASSTNFAGEVLPKTQTVTVNVVSGVVRGVGISFDRASLVVSPGTDTILGGIRVRNTGTAGDTFVLQPTVPATVSGWTFQALPLSQFIPANSSVDFQLRVRAPVDAPAGQAFNVAVKASRLGDNTVSAVKSLAVAIQVRNGIEFAFPLSLTDNLPAGYEAAMQPRDKGANYCPAGSTTIPQTTFCASPNGVIAGVPDSKFDSTFLYRVVVTNTGSIPDKYGVTLTWEPKAGTAGYRDQDGSGACDGNDANKPDFWRSRYDLSGNGSALATKSFSTSTRPTDTLTLAAGEARAVYLQLQWVPGSGSGCTAATAVSKVAPFRLTLRSGNDPGLERSVEMKTDLIAAGTATRQNDYPAATHGAELESELGQTGALTGLPGSKSQHLVRVRNIGNEPDNIIVQVPGSSLGFTRTLTQVGSVPSGITCSPLSSTSPRFSCPLGVYDEALFRVNVTSPATAPIGTVDRAPVSASSGTNGNSAGGDTLELRTTVIGTFGYDAVSLAPTVSAEKGRTVLLPFVLKNIGSNGDRLNVSLVQGDSEWKPRLGLPASNFVPAGKELSGFITVTVPSTATTAKLFRLQVVSQGNGAIDTVDFTVTPVNTGALLVTGVPDNVTTIEQTGVVEQVTVKVAEPAGTDGRQVRLDVLPGSLPAGWKVEPASRQVTLSGTGTEKSGQAVFNVTAPKEALSASRVPMILQATATSGSTASGQGSLLLQLSDIFGVKLAAAGPVNQTIVPGGEVLYNLTLANLGTSTDTIRLSTNAAPTGWTLAPTPPELALGPLENRTVQLSVRAPANAVPRALASTTLQAISLGSGSSSSVLFNTQVGFYELLVNGTSEVLSFAPTETLSRVYTVKNNGTVPDEVAILPSLVNNALAPQVTFKADPPLLTLLANESKEVRVEFTFGAAPPSDSDINANVLFLSRLAPAIAPANVTHAVKLHVLRYVALDVEPDGLPEYAVDRDGVASNGFEAYLDTAAGGGRASQLVDMAGLLSLAAQDGLTKSVVLANGTTVEVLELVIDGDGDGFTDLFVDSTGDGLPDHYWDPDDSESHDLKLVKDVNADAVADYFVDTEGNADYDAVYDASSGTWTPLLAIDIDGDGTKDYVVDKNANGLLDLDETVLYSRGNIFVTVLKVDMDGNGEDDDVFDIDGDGVPDYFIPFGKEGAIEIVIKDVDGDGKDDWAYDTDGDGRVDSYYSPATGKSGLIDPTNSFREALQQYWYIGALFAVVLALFVVLLIVTRR